MPRIARAIAVGFPHHITQRGNNQQRVFTSKSDYKTYLSLLEKYSKKFGLEIWAYCLMPNHLHLVAVPKNPDSMSGVFHTVGTLYSQYFNHRKNRKGHVWQSMFFSCVLGETHLYTAVRYVEMNPVKAGIIDNPEDYRWSSAQVHVNRKLDNLLPGESYLISEIKDWKNFLSEYEDGRIVKEIKSSTISGRPAGNKEFVKKIEVMLGRTFKNSKSSQKNTLK